ncbi:MAG: hypothetical protein EOO73_01335 [Myxococcales bacterium]|nr:MAG: hypothetical protein EOO73_01335 [Myxococcales bacterium]
MRFSVIRPSLGRYGHHAALAAGVALVGLAPSADGDIWWHLAAGREMLARGSVLVSDPFSVSAAGRPWADVHWLFQLATYCIHSAFGLAGLVWAKCAFLAAGALVLGAALGPRAKVNGAHAAFTTLLVAALFSARSLLLLRPVIVTLGFVAVFVFVLEGVSRRGKLSRLWLLPLLQIPWANFQGLSALGPALVAAYAVAASAAALREGKAWPFAREAPESLPAWRHAHALLLALCGCALACGVTPFGARALSLPLMLASRLSPGSDNVYSQAVAENVPPYLLEQYTGGEFWHLKWFIGLLALAMLAAGRRLRLSHAALLLGFAALALMSNRNVLLLYWVGAPIAALYLAPSVRRWLRERRPVLARRALPLLNAAALLAIIAAAGVAAARETSLAEPTPFRAPVESVRRLRALPPGDVFTADHQGGYLSWQLYPRFRPYIDSRLVLRSEDEFQEYLGLCEAPSRFDAFQARHRFRYVLLPTAYPDRYLGLIAHVYGSPDWKLVFTDGAEALFARADILPEQDGVDLSDPEQIQRIVAEADRRYAGSLELRAAARVQLSRMLAAVGELEHAERALAGLEHPTVRALRARLRFAVGDGEGAERLARRALVEDHNDVRSLNLLARVALHRGETAEGADFLKRALDVDPFDLESGDLLTQLQENER